MSLDMPIYKDLTQVEAKVMWGLSWRQLGASALILPVAGGLWWLFYAVFDLSDVGMYVVFVVCLPVALWGWWRPHNLKPEQWARYVFQHWMGKKIFLLDGEARTVKNAHRSKVDERRS